MKKLSHFLRTVEGKFLAAIVVLIALSFAYYFYAMNARKNEPAQEVKVTESDHVRGTPGAKVTVVEFGDFQCPACASYEPIVRQVVSDNAGTVQLVFRHFPLVQIHQNALLSAKASEAAANQGRFWEMHDLLYDKQQEWGGALNARDIMIGYATTLGLDLNQFTSDLNNSAIEEKIVANYREGVSLGVQGTPTFFVNGKRIENPMSIDAFNKIIRDAAAVPAQ